MKLLYQRLRLDDYTGDNRCLPCTVLNLVIAAVLSGLVGLVSVPAAVGSFCLFAGVIYLRGYRVPGTPTLTNRYIPNRVRQWFDTEPTPDFTVAAEAEKELDVERVLLGAGALAESANPGDLVLTPDFEAAWHRRLHQLDEITTKETLAGMLGVAESQISTTEYAQVFALLVDGVQVGRWESEAAFRADIAAGIALEERIEGWDDLTVDQQTGLLHGLRVFLEQCPNCGGLISMAEETVESCCSSKDVFVSRCLDCNTRLFEINAARMEQESS